jgi:hypothetical protein
MKLKASTRIALGFVGLTVAAIVGGRAYTWMRLRGVSLNPIESSKFCLLAVGPDAPVKVITANHMAQIVEVSGSLEATDSAEGGADSGSIKRRIPVRELLGVLDGDSDSVAPFLRQMRRDGDDTEASDQAPLWASEDVLKALKGDPVLTPKLERDTNSKLDGMPLSDLNLVAFYDGIRVKVPVTVAAKTAKGASLNGFDIITYRPSFMVEFYKSMQNRYFDKSSLQLFYKQFIDQKKAKGKMNELATHLARVIQEVPKSNELLKLNRIASRCVILANKSMVKSGELQEEKPEEGSKSKDGSYNLKLMLQGDGPARLWRFSAEGGKSMLVVSDSVPIASATIDSQLGSEELVIKQIADKNLVMQAVEVLRSP